MEHTYSPDELLELIEEIIDGTEPVDPDVYEQLVLDLARAYCKAVNCEVTALHNLEDLEVTLDLDRREP